MTGKKRKTKGHGEPKKDVRGYIIRPVNPEAVGYSEKGHLEGKDAMSAVPPQVRAALQRALKSGRLKINVKRVK